MFWSTQPATMEKQKRRTKTAAWWTFTEGKGREGQRMAICQWAPPAEDENTRPWLLAKTPYNNAMAINPNNFRSHGFALVWVNWCLWFGVLFWCHPYLPGVVALLSPPLLVPLSFSRNHLAGLAFLHLHWNTLLLRNTFFAWETVTPAHFKCIQCP